MHLTFKLIILSVALACCRGTAVSAVPVQVKKSDGEDIVRRTDYHDEPPTFGKHMQDNGLTWPFEWMPTTEPDHQPSGDPGHQPSGSPGQSHLVHQYPSRPPSEPPMHRDPSHDSNSDLVQPGSSRPNKKIEAKSTERVKRYRKRLRDAAAANPDGPEAQQIMKRNAEEAKRLRDKYDPKKEKKRKNVIEDRLHDAAAANPDGPEAERLGDLRRMNTERVKRAKRNKSEKGDGSK